MENGGARHDRVVGIAGKRGLAQRFAPSPVKLVRFVLVVNALQLAAASVFAGLIVTQPNLLSVFSGRAVGFAMGFCAAVAAALSYQQARGALEALDTSQRRGGDREDAMAKLEQLNLTLRAQRHDFLNHLQVVYSLAELNDTEEMRAYIRRVYGDIQRVSRTLRTASPAVNALLTVKLAECEKRGVQAELAINADWAQLAMPGWEMCRVLGNLIDNAMDAAQQAESPRVTVTLSEDVDGCLFMVGNNGPAIPENRREAIFQAGWSTKAEGRGMGLHIVRGILRAAGGFITVHSDENGTVFMGEAPKKAQIPAQPPQPPQPSQPPPSNPADRQESAPRA